MELFSVQFFSALLTIIFIDLMLAGDNAIVIGLSARKLPKAQQKSAILWGTAGAVFIRIVATVLVVYLLQVPWLMVAGGILLLWIAYKLLIQEEADGHEIKAGSTLWQSIRTIIIADAAMGIDNVIAVAGAANHDVTLVIIGLLVSIPIVVWGSTIFIKLIERMPWIIYAGSGILAFTAAKMITHEPKIDHIFKSNEPLAWSFMILMIIAVITAGLWTNKTRERKQHVQSKSRETL